ncbi:MAG: hypothetical protein H6595_05985 [Flavobacteriales bacterium]|nr:hypothetical protein [Flavobacteriales bacterium]MCB9167015.1 hypothetical protein [Flavobacteriales bacterium]
MAGIVLGCWLMDLLAMRFLILPARSAGAYKVHRMFTGNAPDEVPILGSSRAAGSYVPERIDAHAFDYGIEKTEHELVEVMLAEELRKERRTPILINWDFEFFQHKVGNMAHFVPNLEHPTVRAYVAEELHWYHRFPGLRFFGLYDDYLKALLGERSKGNVRSAGGVFDNGRHDRSRFQEQVRRRLATQMRWIDPQGKDSVFLDLVRSTDRRIIIVAAPYHRSYFTNFKDLGAAQAYLAGLDSLVNVTVLDHSRDELPDVDFLNTSHVNYTGAQVFSERLGREWTALFPDRR